MVSEILVNTGSDNRLLPDGIKPLPEPNVELISSVRSNDNPLQEMSQEIPEPLIIKMKFQVYNFIEISQEAMIWVCDSYDPITHILGGCVIDRDTRLLHWPFGHRMFASAHVK